MICILVTSEGKKKSPILISPRSAGVLETRSVCVWGESQVGRNRAKPVAGSPCRVEDLNLNGRTGREECVSTASGGRKPLNGAPGHTSRPPGTQGSQAGEVTWASQGWPPHPHHEGMLWDVQKPKEGEKHRLLRDTPSQKSRVRKALHCSEGERVSPGWGWHGSARKRRWDNRRPLSEGWDCKGTEDI